jgi:hypothetical protein
MRETVCVGLEKDIYQRLDKADQHPGIHHLYPRGFGLRVRDANEPAIKEIKSISSTFFPDISLISLIIISFQSSVID